MLYFFKNKQLLLQKIISQILQIMNQLKPLFILSISIILMTSIGYSQPTSKVNNPKSSPQWVNMMKDVSINFYDVQKAANEYFEVNGKAKGSGWKQYKRWEHFTEQRVYPSGMRINHAQIWDEVTKYNKQFPSNNKSNRNAWTPLGPATSANVTGHWNPGIGRINVIALEPGNAQTIYIGSPSGGLWKTTNEGENWIPLTDNQPVLGVSAIVINPANTDVIYIGTGDKDANDNYSIGILKSTDGGITWNTTGLDWTIYQNRTISKLLMDPNDPNTIYAATTDGLYKTTDAGNSWNQTLSGNIDDMEFKPGDASIIYAITTRFYKSTDSGENFIEITDVPNSSRAQIAVSNDNPSYVYFLSSGSGIYRSENSGDSFVYRSAQPTPGNQSWYDLAFAVSHDNAEEVHLGEFNTWKSTDGGINWNLTTDWTWDNPIGYTHCDIHEMVFYEGVLYVGSDGLISKSDDGGSTWVNLTEGISMRQFYRIGTSKNDPYKIMGGSQDNGTSIYTNDHWHEWLGADGMECIINYDNSNIVYGTSQNGQFYKSTTGGNFGNIGITQPGGGNWVTPFVIHPTDPQILFVGSDEVRKTTNGMNSWTTISNFGMGNLNNLAIAESNADYLYASKNSNIYRTRNGGESWANISNGLPNLHISYIAIHPENPETIAVSLSGYDEGEKVYISKDGGTTWTNYSTNLPNIPANCVAFYLGDLNPLYVGMDAGVYYIDEDLSEWTSYMEELPNVIVNELEMQFDNQLIRAATYGRGLWEVVAIIYAPIASFEANQTTIPIGCSNNFINNSQGPPETYQWTFEGGTPSTSSEKHPPEIVYDTEGTYDVQLIVSNSLGSDTLLKEDYITVSTTLLPTINFVASDSMTCSGTEIQLFDQTINCPDTWEWSISPLSFNFVDGTDANSQNPKVIFELGTYSVTLTSSNTVGSSTLTKTNYIHSGGSSLPFIEDFEFDNIDKSSWVVENPDEDITWEITEVIGSQPGNKAPWINFINYPHFRERDRLISPPINFTGINNLVLTFDYAYAQRYAQIDSLLVFISDDCGENWTKIYENGPDGTGIFATSIRVDSSFVPQSSADWCGEGWGSSCPIIDLSNWDNKPNIKIMFESFTLFGNNLYIDNILISNNVGIPESSENEFNVRIIPNPSLGIFTIHANDMVGNIGINIINSQGQVFLSETTYNAEGNFERQINLQNHAKGIYFLKLSTKLGVEVEKILVK